MEMVVNVKRMRMRCKHVDDVSLQTYIHTYISTAIFLVAMISVRLAQARPNYRAYLSFLVDDTQPFYTMDVANCLLCEVLYFCTSSSRTEQSVHYTK